MTNQLYKINEPWATESSGAQVPDDFLSRFLPEKVPYEHRVFVNRTLRLDHIDVVGFDMDYTLAQYTLELKHLAARLTCKRLVEVHGYPEDAAAIGYDHDFPIRGTVIDKQHGNIFKMDAHKHVERVFHGLRRLRKDERHKVYRQGVIRMQRGRYALMDTLFALPEVYLYARLVELMEERNRGRKLRAAGYRKIYDDIRESIDAVHRDGSLKRFVVADMGRYIVRDSHLVSALEAFLVAGKRLFLLTNSAWDYTDAVMSYILDGQSVARPSWRDWFEVVIVSAGKPSFFTSRKPFVRVAPEPVARDEELPDHFAPGAVYEGGNIHDFERLSGMGGDRVLYVGDHIYGDMLRSKKACAWRTAMVVPELEGELRVLDAASEELRLRDTLDAQRVELDDDLTFQLLVRDRLIGARREVDNGHEGAALTGALAAVGERIAALEAAIHVNLIETRALLSTIESRFNAYWGMLFKTDTEHSVFGSQVEDYACVYTSRVSNFRHYSPLQYFRTPRDPLPHERRELFGR